VTCRRSRKRIGKHVSTEIRFVDTNHHWVFNKRVHGYEQETNIFLGKGTLSGCPDKDRSSRKQSQAVAVERRTKDYFTRHSSFVILL
jgi:hypothetical protein